ncbi:MAG: PTS system mannose/fructose/sorbose family transporter subunit IID [Collinsella sp.]|nr:PTS system mannose/fructose/sorbose family transporter subunit IID [Collinsella sp.]
MIMFPEAANAKVTATSEEDVKEKSGLLNKQDVTKSFWLYYFGCEESNSYERLQSLVYCASMIPCLKKLYPKKEDLSEALKRHLAFFNTEGTLGGVIQGISIAMEEEAATEGTVPGSAITSIKTGLMGPIAGMGDGIVWAVVMPIIYGVFIPYASQGSALGGIMPLILWPGITIIIQYFMTHRGYKLGRQSITGILQSGMMQSIIFAANVLGLIMMGALSSSYITISTPFQITMGAGNTLVFQEILDAVVPGILPLVAVFGIYFYMQKKGPRYNVILLSIIVISVVCALLGIL